jgi:hypothetical protein
VTVKTKDDNGPRLTTRRGDDKEQATLWVTVLFIVIPAKAGIQ